jgi:aryl-alcohol dehydrogenase-like predicted oxidoreductase
LLLPRRRLGLTGFEASILTLGGCALGNLSQEEADKAIKLAFEYGVNMVDVSPVYGQAELRLASWVEKHREKLFIAEKTLERSKEKAAAELQHSLKKLRTRKFNLYQLHGVGTFQELEGALQKDGAIEALKEAQETGLIDYIGITGHRDMRVLKKAIEEFDFDSVLLPVNIATMVDPKPENDFRPILKEAAERDLAVIAIKAIAKSRWKTGNKQYTTWYEPTDKKEEIKEGLYFTLSQEMVASYALPCDVRLWQGILETAIRFEKLDGDEQRKAIKHATEIGFKPLFPTKTEEFSSE